MSSTFAFAAAVVFVIYRLVRRIVRETCEARPGLRTLSADLDRLGAVVVDLDAYTSQPRTISDLREYYGRTSFRDYMILRLTYGWELMHTVLRHPFAEAEGGGGGLSSLMHVVAHLACASTTRAATGITPKKNVRVLEIGCGKGANCLYLASVFGSRGATEVVGVDAVEAHCGHATREARRLGLDGGDKKVSFRCEDATTMTSASEEKYDLVFGLESFCHFDTPEKRRGVMASVADRLEPDGKLVLVDGFRRADCDLISDAEMRKKAMRLSERAFQIDAKMPTKEDWKAECARCCGGGLELEEDIVLTAEAAPFWTGRWWKAAHALLQLAPTCALRTLRKRLPYTFDNLVAACFVGQAFHFGVAEYGVLVFRKRR